MRFCLESNLYLPFLNLTQTRTWKVFHFHQRPPEAGCRGEQFFIDSHIKTVRFYPQNRGVFGFSFQNVYAPYCFISIHSNWWGVKQGALIWPKLKDPLVDPTELQTYLCPVQLLLLECPPSWVKIHWNMLKTLKTQCSLEWVFNQIYFI